MLTLATIIKRHPASEAPIKKVQKAIQAEVLFADVTDGVLYLYCKLADLVGTENCEYENAWYGGKRRFNGWKTPHKIEYARKEVEASLRIRGVKVQVGPPDARHIAKITGGTVVISMPIKTKIHAAEQAKLDTEILKALRHAIWVAELQSRNKLVGDLKKIVSTIKK